MQRQAMIWTSARLLSIGPLGTNFSEILIKTQKTFIHENASENFICEKATIISGGDELTGMELTQFACNYLTNA